MQDVGLAVLESYSRILESLAFTVLSRIEDVLYADYATQNPAHIGKKGIVKSSPVPKSDKFSSPKEDTDKSGAETPCSMTLSDFMGWGVDQGDQEMKNDPFANTDDCKDLDAKQQKFPNVNTNKKTSYLENLGGVRSPTSRH